MADRYVNTALGTNGDGSASSPWNRIPDTASGDAAGNTVSAGDTVNIQVGSHTFGERLTISKDNTKFLPWHAYGTGTPLVLTLPVPGRPWEKRQVEVNQGVWEVENQTGSGACIAYGTNRVGVQVDSVHAKGGNSTGSGVAMGLSSTTTGTGNSLTNSRVTPLTTGGTSTGVSVNTLNVLLYRVKIDSAAGDTVVIYTHANNGNRAGSTDRIIECDIGPANQGTLTGDKDSQTGDEIQVQNGTLNAGLSNTIIKGCYLFKNSAGKQVILVGGQGWCLVQGNLLEAEPSTLMTGLGADRPNGATIMLNAGWARHIICGNVLRNSRNGFPFFATGVAMLRVVDGEDVTDSTRTTTDTLFLSNLLIPDGASAFNMSGTVNGGRVRVIGNTCIGTVQDASGNNGTTAAANGFTYEESENAWLAYATGYGFNWNQLSSAFTFKNNRYGLAAGGWRAQGATHATVAAALAGMSGAGAVVTGSADLFTPLVDQFGRPAATSSLLLDGDATRAYRRTITGMPARRHIGAFGALALYAAA